MTDDEDIHEPCRRCHGTGIDPDTESLVAAGILAVGALLTIGLGFLVVLAMLAQVYSHFAAS
jgi:hypothetical protein